MTRNNGKSTDGRNPDGTFAEGNPGRPNGARHKITQAVEDQTGRIGKLARGACESRDHAPQSINPTNHPVARIRDEDVS